jgi:uncharacterized protein
VSFGDPTRFGGFGPTSFKAITMADNSTDSASADRLGSEPLSDRAPLKWVRDGFSYIDSARHARPFYTFLLKVASLCNLNCSYCYVYQSPDDSWKVKPKFLEPETAHLIAAAIQQHVVEHELSDVAIVFHGGEPLLAGRERLEVLVDILSSVVSCRIQWGLQTNGTLLDRDLIEFLFEHRFSMGLSIDGTRAHNDRHRIYHSGASSYDDTVRAIRLLQSYPDWRQVLEGVLVVIDIRNHPADILQAVADLGVPGVKLLLPDAHHDSPPPYVERGTRTYGKWLCDFFDTWLADFPNLKVPLLEQIMTLVLGGVSTAEEIGAKSVDLVVVEANGDIEAVDTLKIVGREATHTGMNVATHTFSEALSHPAFYSRMSAFDALCDTCTNCEHLAHCGGGYMPHRYSGQNGFLNPSVYCEDLKYLFSHMLKTLIV